MAKIRKTGVNKIVILCWPRSGINYSFTPASHKILPINLFSSSNGNLSQAVVTAFYSSLRFCGFCSWTIVLIWSHRCSTGLRSGESAGQSITVILSSSNQFLPSMEVWHDALSCWNIQPLGTVSTWVVGI